MKKLFALAFGMLLLGAGALAQTTSVTATVTDSDGTIWKNGTWSVDFVANPANPYGTYYFNGSIIPPSMIHQSGSIDSSGALSFIVDQNASITPVGSSWNLKVCPDAIAQCGIFNFTAIGASMDLSAFLTTAIPAPRFHPVSGAYGYNDTEAILSLVPGSTYWNVSSSLQRCYSGSAWTVCNSGNGTNTPSPQFQVPYYLGPGTSAIIKGDSGITTDGSGNLTALSINSTIKTAINVKSPPYNAKGDGTTDDTAAVQAAVNASDAATADCIYFPPGTYSINTINLAPTSSNLCVEGSGIDRTTLKSRSGNDVLDVTGTSLADGIIRDLTIQGNGGTGKGISIPATISFADEIEIDNVKVVSTGGTAISLLGTATFNVLIQNSSASSIGGNDFEIHGSPSCTLINTYAVEPGSGFAGYRIHSGKCVLISANGIAGGSANEDWGVFGDNVADDGILSYAFPVIIGSNVESFTRYGVRIKNGSVKLIDDDFLNNSTHSTATVEAVQMNSSSGTYPSSMDGMTSISSSGSPSFGFTGGYALHEVGNGCYITSSFPSSSWNNQPTSCYSDALALAYNIPALTTIGFAYGVTGLQLTDAILNGDFRIFPGALSEAGASDTYCGVEGTGYRLECSYNGDTYAALLRVYSILGTLPPGDTCSAASHNGEIEINAASPPVAYLCSNATGSYAWNAIGSNVPSLVINGDSAITAGPRAFIQADTGNLTSIVASGQYNPVKAVKAGTIENIVATASTFTCTGNPTITLEDCGTSAGACASPTALGSATVTAANTSVDGTITSATITAGHYLVWETTAGTCTALNISASAEYRMN